MTDSSESELTIKDEDGETHHIDLRELEAELNEHTE